MHSPAEDITAIGETLFYLIINQSYRITSARRLKCVGFQPARLAGALRAQSETLLSLLTPGQHVDILRFRFCWSILEFLRCIKAINYSM